MLENNLFDKILDHDNIVSAYFELLKKVDEESKSSTLQGVDGVSINNINYSSKEIIKIVEEEIKNLKPTNPPFKILIPKKTGKYRSIYIFSIKDRIRAEAIYRVVSPFFDEYLSDFLYSYRKSHPAYYASRSVIRRYKRFYGSNHILVADLSDYTDSIDHELLISSLDKICLDQKTKNLIEIFIKSSYFENGKLIKINKGLMTGTPISGLLSNLFMDDFDKIAGKYVDFYRRVGDDMIAFDKDKNKILSLQKTLSKMIKEKKLILNKNKLKVISDKEPFVFLGYRFKNNKIGVNENSLIKIISSLKKTLYRYPGSNKLRKKKHFSLNFESNYNSIFIQFKQIIEQKKLIDDDNQILNFSEKFYRIITKYFFDKYSEKNRRETEKLFRYNKIDSLYNHYNKKFKK